MISAIVASVITALLGLLGFGAVRAKLQRDERREAQEKAEDQRRAASEAMVRGRQEAQHSQQKAEQAALPPVVTDKAIDDDLDIWKKTQGKR